MSAATNDGVRRAWSLDERQRIFTESPPAPGASAAAVARRRDQTGIALHPSGAAREARTADLRRGDAALKSVKGIPANTL